MEKTTFYPRLMLRLPAWSIEDAGQQIHHLLKNRDFLDAVKLASDAAYQKMGKAAFNPVLMSTSLKDSLLRYHQRMCRRATPFGLFASVGLVEWQQAENEIVVTKSKKLMVYEDQNEYPGQAEIYQLNPLMYQAGSKYRIHDHGEAGGAYFLTEVSLDSIPDEIAARRDALSRKELLYILKKEGLKRKDAEVYLHRLLTEQILIEKPRQQAGQARRVNDSDEKLGSEGYTCSFHCTTGGVPEKVQQELKEGLSILNALFGRAKQHGMEEFKNRFRMLYDRRCVSLLEALDAEVGIAYASCLPEKQEVAWSAAHTLLLQKWTAASANGTDIVFDGTEKLLKENTEHVNYPPGMMAMFTRNGGLLNLKGAGGCTAVALPGRFTLFSEEFTRFCRDICLQEKQLNPDVIFADISFAGSPGQLLLNRHRVLRDMQVSLYGALAEKDENQLPLHDLYLVLHHNELMMFSKTLGKRIVPRISSAYNYHHSKSYLVHFLGDLQYEGLSSGFTSRLEEFFPGQYHYPRLRYRDVILAPASWRLDAGFTRKLSSVSEEEASSLFLAEWRKRGMPDQLCYGQYDQRMFVCPGDNQSVQLMLRYLRNREGACMLTENLDEGSPATVKDGQGKPFAAEYIAFLHNNSASYQAAPVELLYQYSWKRDFFPLQEWHYLKFYMAPEAMDEFLVEKVMPFVEGQQAQDHLFLWHFLRFRDSSHHLRLRMKSSSGNDGALLTAIKTWLATLESEPGIFNVSIDTYEREIERYAEVGLEVAEVLFMRSSEWALAQIAQVEIQQERMLQAIHLLQRLMELRLTPEDIRIVCRKSYETYFENISGTHERRGFDQAFREMKNNLLENDGKRAVLPAAEEESFRQLAAELQPEVYSNFVADFFHLHVNRLTGEHPRAKEALCYYSLEKLLISRAAVASLRS